jgi:AraC-like DNA-binding protein
MSENAWGFDKICMVLQGNGYLDCAGEKFPLRASDLVYIPAETRHCFLDNEPMTLAVLCVDHSKLQSEKRLHKSYLSLASNFEPKIPFPMGDSWSILRTNELLRQMIAEGYLDDQASELVKIGLFCEFLVLLLRLMNTLKDSPVQNRSLEMLLQHLERRFTENQSVPELAKSCSMSVRKFSTLFKERTGKSVIQWIVDKRVTHAAHLLSEQASVTSATFSSGFSDSAHFFRAFKQRFNMSPKEYRERNKGE